MGPCLRRSGGPTDLQHRSSIWRCGGKDIVSGNRSANALEFKLPNRLDGHGVQEVEECARRCSVPDPLDENARPSALAPETLRLRRYYILTAANAACAKGIAAFCCSSSVQQSGLRETVGDPLGILFPLEGQPAQMFAERVFRIDLHELAPNATGLVHLVEMTESGRERGP